MSTSDPRSIDIEIRPSSVRAHIFHVRSAPRIEPALIQAAHREWAVMQVKTIEHQLSPKNWTSVSIVDPMFTLDGEIAQIAILWHYLGIHLREEIDRDPIRNQRVAKTLRALGAMRCEPAAVATDYRPFNLRIACDLWKQHDREPNYRDRWIFKQTAKARLAVEAILAGIN